MQPPQIAG